MWKDFNRDGIKTQIWLLQRLLLTFIEWENYYNGVQSYFGTEYNEIMNYNKILFKKKL